jgi:hypothetical protein
MLHSQDFKALLFGSVGRKGLGRLSFGTVWNLVFGNNGQQNQLDKPLAQLL